jgi:hypothetical protein
MVEDLLRQHIRESGIGPVVPRTRDALKPSPSMHGAAEQPQREVTMKCRKPICAQDFLHWNISLSDMPLYGTTTATRRTRIDIDIVTGPGSSSLLAHAVGSRVSVFRLLPY